MSTCYPPAGGRAWASRRLVGVVVTVLAGESAGMQSWFLAALRRSGCAPTPDHPRGAVEALARGLFFYWDTEAEGPTVDAQSVTKWLDRLKAGDRDDAVARLWERYFSQLVRHARRHLAGRRTVADGEDVALSAFDAFVRAVDTGRFPKLDDRTDLWAVLLRLTANKARNAVRNENRQRRGGGMAWHGIAEAESGTSDVPVPSADPEPAEAAALAEEAEALLGALSSGELRQVALLALEGRTNVEIGAQIGKSVAAVERKRRLIRDIWTARRSA